MVVNIRNIGTWGTKNEEMIRLGVPMKQKTELPISDYGNEVKKFRADWTLFSFIQWKLGYVSSPSNVSGETSSTLRMFIDGIKPV